ncbi:MAG: phosphoglycerate mutase [Proteobacteria bacterium]|nr:phosphoglycerate mutase [Pseudomonadota bacterium]
MRLSLLLPARKHAERSAALARWTARGDRPGDAAPGRDIVLRECFAFAGATLPVAALTRSLDGDEADAAIWLRADPAFVMADAVTLRLLQSGNMGLHGAEVEAFAEALRPLFGDAGMPFDAPHPQRWYLRCERGAKLPRFSSPDDALGDDLAHHLPEGDDARRWRGLLNEAQIVLTQHPLNAQRVRRGLPPVNSLWIWGAGVLPESVRCEFNRVCSDDEVVTALARLARVGDVCGLGEAASLFPAALASSASARSGEESSILIDLGRHRDGERLEREWLAPIDAALRGRRVGTLNLLFESGERCVVKPVHRWRFWRRAKSTA